MKKADIGIIGLAVMGENLAMNMESKGFTVAVYNRSTEKVDRFLSGRAEGRNFIGCHSPEALADALEKPRKIFMMVKAGAAVDVPKLFPEALSQRCVKGGEGLVQKKDPGFRCNGTGKGDALGFASAELQDLAFCVVLKAYEFKQLFGFLLLLLGCFVLHAVLDVLLHVHGRKEGEVLEDHADSSLLDASPRDVFAIEDDASALGVIYAGNQGKQG